MNLAITYGKLWRHQDAVVMHEKTLGFLRRALPENHPDVGATCLCGRLNVILHTLSCRHGFFEPWRNLFYCWRFPSS
jgi:hypothetical protein